MAADTAMPPPGVLTVDLDALAKNYDTLRASAAQAACGAVVKANAYGLGVAPVARRLWEEGCRHFFVATVREGAELRAVLARARIFVFEGAPAGSAGGIVDAALIPILNSIGQIRQWRKAAPGRPAAIHLDTGLSRLGLSAADVREISRKGLLRGLDIQCALTHLACADAPSDPMNVRQVRDFAEWLELLPGPRTSIGASAGTLLGPGFQGQLVRPGIALYGGSPFAGGERPGSVGGPFAPREDSHPAGDALAGGGIPYPAGGPLAGGGRPLEPVVTLEGVILQTRTVTRRRTVGYGATHTAEPGARLATVGVGYADGYPRALGNRGVAFVAGAEVPVVGRVSMDLLTLDVSRLAPAEAQPGDAVELLGRNVLLDDLARAAGTIGYEILTGLGRRWQRRYLP